MLDTENVFSGIGRLSWFLSYPNDTILPTGLIPNHSADDAGYVETKNIFAQCIDNILSKFEISYPNILNSILYPDPFYDPRVCSLYMLNMQTRNLKIPNGPTDQEVYKARAIFETRICH